MTALLPFTSTAGSFIHTGSPVHQVAAPAWSPITLGARHWDRNQRIAVAVGAKQCSTLPFCAGLAACEIRIVLAASTWPDSGCNLTELCS